ncbi:MAG: YceG family protein [Ruminococcus flavefaciens]|nr:YceG family protein [Ruminococcus flavefaciens]
MFQHIKIGSLDDYFLNLNQRNGNSVFFYRINSYSEKIWDFLCRYYDEARKNGVIIDGRIPNVDQNQLSYYYEMMGEDFSMDKQFIMTSLQKWLPRMNAIQRNEISGAMYDVLYGLSLKGKNQNILKNAYIKFMCWLYYRFESLTSRLGENSLPKIFCNGIGSHYELMLLSMLSGAGCDIVLVQTAGNTQYDSYDPTSEISDIWADTGTSFPADFSVKKIQQAVAEKINAVSVCGQKPAYTVETNGWARGDGLDDILTPPSKRIEIPDVIGNIFYQINGVYSRADYVNELISFRNTLNSQKRNFIVVNGEIDEPSYEEISAIKRSNYSSPAMAVTELARNINSLQDSKLQQMIRYEFSQIMLKYSGDYSINRFVNMCVYVLCWLKRWQKQLFSNWKKDSLPCFVFFNCSMDENQSAFAEILSALPVDVLILNPAMKNIYQINNQNLVEFTYDSPLDIEAFPDGVAMRAGTVAYHAERELDTLMYQDTGIYRNHQYAKASSIVLDTMFEEIEILWNEELKYRPNFSTENGEVMIPVFFAKVSGVKDGNVKAYWQFVKRLMTEDTVVINGYQRTTANPHSANANVYSSGSMNTRSLGSVNPYSLGNANPYSANVRSTAPAQQGNTSQSAVAFWKNGVLQRTAIKNSPNYQYKVLREEMQEHILDKLQMLIESRIIKGTFENGMEYKIISTILDLDKEIVRKLQNFDFTKKNPKVLYINTGENAITVEQAIVMEFLSMAGFDILFIIPTGYCNVENHYSRSIISEHQTGEYMYDMKYPDFSRISAGSRQPWHKKLFGRGV